MRLREATGYKSIYRWEADDDSEAKKQWVFCFDVLRNPNYEEWHNINACKDTDESVRVDRLEALIDFMHFLLNSLGVVGAWADRTTVAR